MEEPAPEPKPLLSALSVAGTGILTLVVALCVLVVLFGLKLAFDEAASKARLEQARKTEEQRQAREMALVTIKSVELKCPPGFPIGVRTRNGTSSLTVKKVTFRIEVYEEGRSIPQEDWGAMEYVVDPGASLEACYPIHLLTPPQARWKYVVRKEDVVFFEPDEFVPRFAPRPRSSRP